MSGTVTVASKIPTAVQMRVTPQGSEPIVVAIAGGNDPAALYGWGLTEGVDAAVFNTWLAENPHLAEFVTVATQQHIDDVIAQNDPSLTHGFELGLVPVDPVEPPVNIDVPFIWQEEQRMRCTMGNWANEPTSYSYQWMQDGDLPIGPDNDTLPLIAGNDGHSISCIVTATNASGSTEAPPSNSVLYTAPTEATAALLISADFSDTEWSDMIASVGSNPGEWRGFDIVVDGIVLTLRAQFSVTTAADICAVINAALGAYLVASSPTADAPWQFNIHSVTTGITSTISYAAAPSFLAELDDADPLKQTADLSLVMRLRQATGAIVVQGIDASGAASAETAARSPTSAA